jgi:hypothetical protein
MEMKEMRYLTRPTRELGSKPGLQSAPLPHGNSKPAAVRRRTQVVKLLADAGYQITAQRRLPNKLGWQLRLTTGQVVNVYDTGSLVVQGVGPEPVKRLLHRVSAATAAQRQGNATPARVTSNLPRPDKRGPVWLAHQETDPYIDANGYPIRLPGTDAVLALGPPPPAPKLWENPKTLRHMCNRLRSLGYSVKSSKWAVWASAWQIDLTTGQTIYFQENGNITLDPFQRDYRLERLFKIND